MSAPRKYDRKRAAKIVLEARQLGLPPGRALMSLLGISENASRHLLHAIREEGLLGAGGHQPARAVIHRATDHEQAWMVCEHCLVTWPCKHAFATTTPT